MPIPKRPIEKVTTRSQTQYQQLIKTFTPETLLDSRSRNSNNHTNSTNNNNNNINNHASNFITSRTSTNLVNNGTALNLKTTTSRKATTNNHQQSTTTTTTTSLGLPTRKALPKAPREVLEYSEFLIHLTGHEKREILEHSKIYFLGRAGIKKRTPQTSTVFTGQDGLSCKVYGFDDNNGSYIPVIHDHIAYRYEVLKIIGKGTFGVVLQAYDHNTLRSVALKIIRNQTRFHTQAKEEIKILTKLLENDPDDKFNIVHMYDHFMFRHHPCIVFELLSLNLFELSRLNSFNGFGLSLIRRFTYSIVKCLHALWKHDIIHCDLKPENILLKQQNRSGIKVIDFGSSCFSNKRVHTYIQSRYYRSPEVILCGKYGPSIDMWSLGCILSELFIGRPLLDGENEGDQLACMMELLNVPSPNFLSRCKTSKVRQFFDNIGNPIYCARYVQGQYRPEANRSPRGKIRGQPGSRRLLPLCSDDDFVDFVRKCLIWDPLDRMVPIEALKHPWLGKRAGQISSDNAVYELMSQ